MSDPPPLPPRPAPLKRSATTRLRDVVKQATLRSNVLRALGVKQRDRTTRARKALRQTGKLGSEALARLSQAMKLGAGSPTRVGPNRKAPNAKAAMEAFKKYDADGNGHLSFREACAAFKDMATKEGLDANALTSAVLEGAFNIIDEDDNAMITPEEWRGAFDTFTHWMRDEQRRLDDEKTEAAKLKRNSGLTAEEYALGQEVEAHVQGGAAGGGGGGSTTRMAQREHDKVRMILLQQHEGGSSGPKYTRKDFSTEAKVRMNEHFLVASGGMQTMLDGAADATLGLAHFRVLCADVFGVRSAHLQESLFRYCSPQAKDADAAGKSGGGGGGGKKPGSARAWMEAKVAAKDLLDAIAPAVHGSAPERAAFMFLLYDLNVCGKIDMKLLGRLHEGLEIGCAVEKDILAFSKRCREQAAEAAKGRTGGSAGAKGAAAASSKEFGYEHYVAHVEAAGECTLLGALKSSVA